MLWNLNFNFFSLRSDFIKGAIFNWEKKKSTPNIRTPRTENRIRKKYSNVRRSSIWICQILLELFPVSCGFLLRFARDKQRLFFQQNRRKLQLINCEFKQYSCNCMQEPEYHLDPCRNDTVNYMEKLVDSKSVCDRKLNDVSEISGCRECRCFFLLLLFIKLFISRRCRYIFLLETRIM